MDPSRDFAFVIMDATDQIGGIQISNEGHPHILGFEKGSGSGSLPLKILDKNGEDCSNGYKVVDCYFEVDGDKVVPVDVVRVQEELAKSNRQNEACGWSGGENGTSHLNGMPEKLETEKEKGLKMTDSQTTCLESNTVDAGVLDLVKPDCPSVQSDDLPQLTFNVRSSSYMDCSPVEKTRRMEVRVEDFRLLSAKRDGTCCDKDPAEEEMSTMVQSEECLFDLENEKLPRITRSQAKKDVDAGQRRSGRLLRDDGSDKKPNTCLRRLSTGKLTVDVKNREHHQQRKSFPSFNKDTKTEIFSEATAKRKSLRKSQNLQAVQSPEIKEVQNKILESAVPPDSVQKRPLGRPRKVVVQSADDKAMVKDSEKNFQQKADDEVVNKKLSKQDEGGLTLENEDVLKTDEGVDCQLGFETDQGNLAATKLIVEDLIKLDLPVVQNKHEESLVAVEMFCENVHGILESTVPPDIVQKRPLGRPRKIVVKSAEDKAMVKDSEKNLQQKAEDEVVSTDQENLAAAKPIVEDLIKLDLPVVQNRHEESLVAVEMFCENVLGQNAPANETLNKSENNLSQKLHAGNSGSAAVDWDDESQSSYDVLLLKELSTDGSESKQVSDVDNPKEWSLPNTEQTSLKRISEFLADIKQLMNQNSEHFAFNASASESFSDVTVVTEDEQFESVKAEQGKLSALQKELNARAQTLNSTEAELLARETQLKELQLVYDIEDAKNALRQEHLASARLEVAEERRKVAAAHILLKSSRYRGKVPTPIKPLGTRKNLIKTSTIQFFSKRQSEEAELQSSTESQEASLIYSSTIPEIVAGITTENTSAMSQTTSSVVSVLETTGSTISTPVDESVTISSATKMSPSSSSVSSIGTTKHCLGSCLPLKAVHLPALSSALPSYHPSSTEPSPKCDIPLSLSFRPNAGAASNNPSASFNIPLSHSSSFNVDAATALPSNAETLPYLSSSCLSDEVRLPSSASEVEICLPSALVETEVLPPSSPSRTELLRTERSASEVETARSSSEVETVQPASSSSVAEILPSVSSPSLTENLPPASSFSLAEILTSVSSSSVVKILPPVSSSSVAETLPPVSSSVAETLPPASSSVAESLLAASPLKTGTLHSTSPSLLSGIEGQSPTKASNSSPSTPSSCKSTLCRNSSILCDNISPTCRHLFSNSVCMLPSVTLVPVTTPYVLNSPRITDPCMTDLEETSPTTRLPRKRAASSGNKSKSKKLSKH